MNEEHAVTTVSSGIPPSTTYVDPAALPMIPSANPVARPANVTSSFEYMPRTLNEAMEFAQMLSQSTMVPKDYIDKPGNVLIAIQMGAELGLKPMQAMQSLAVINGKPGLYGDAGKALLLSAGCQIVERDIGEIEVTGTAECTIKRQGRQPVTRTFSIDHAKKANLWGKQGPWSQYPFRQLAWRAFWFAARDAAADILKGMQPAEEIADMDVDTQPRAVAQMPQRRAEAPAAEEPKVSPPASVGQIKHLRRVLTGDGCPITEDELCAKFKVDKLESATVAIGNAMLGWINGGDFSVEPGVVGTHEPEPAAA